MMDTTSLPDEHNALIANHSVSTTKIVFPFHPHCGREIEILEIIGGRQPYLIGRFPDGKSCRLPLSWTELEQPYTDSSPTETCLASISDLLKIADKLQEIKQRR